MNDNVCKTKIKFETEKKKMVRLQLVILGIIFNLDQEMETKQRLPIMANIHQIQKEINHILEH